MNTKLKELLLTLKNKNIDELLEFSQISLAGLQKEERLLFKEFIQEFKKSKKKFDETVFFTGSNINVTRNRFLRLINLYIHTASFNIDTAFKSDYLAEWYAGHNVDKNYRTYLNKINSQLKKSAHDELKNFQMFKQAEDKSRTDKNVRKRNNTVKEMEQFLDAFYVENKLKILSENVNRRKIIHVDKEEENEILELLLKKNNTSDNLGVIMYKKVYKLLTEKEDKSHFSFLKELLNSLSYKELSKDYQRDIYTYLLNYCSISVSEGKFEYAEEYIGLIETLAEKKILFDNNEISIFKFKNTTTSGIIAKKYIWLENFQDTYKSKLSSEKRVDVYNYNSALLQFHLGKHDEALELIEQTKFKDIYFKLATYKLRLKILDALNNYEKFDYVLDSLKIFIHRNNDLPEKVITQSKLFCKVSKTIVLDEKKMNIKDLKGKLAAMDYFWIWSR